MAFALGQEPLTGGFGKQFILGGLGGLRKPWGGQKGIFLGAFWILAPQISHPRVNPFQTRPQGGYTGGPKGEGPRFWLPLWERIWGAQEIPRELPRGERERGPGWPAKNPLLGFERPFFPPGSRGARAHFFPFQGRGLGGFLGFFGPGGVFVGRDQPGGKGGFLFGPWGSWARGFWGATHGGVWALGATFTGAFLGKFSRNQGGLLGQFSRRWGQFVSTSQGFFHQGGSFF